jgi:NRPS condensation-like uncharacterized protein
MQNIVPRFIPVDNAAQIFVAINSKKETTMSRIALTLKHPIDLNLMNDALKKIIKAFPFFQVYLRKHFFNYVFERTDDLPIIEKDTKWTNRYINFEQDKFPFKIKVLGSTIALEMSHIITDGYGTLSFLLSLTNEYLRSLNYEIESNPIIKLHGDSIIPEEWQCAFRKIFPQKGPSVKMNPQAYIPKGEMISVKKYYSTRIIMNLKELQTKARKLNVTLNIYVSAIYTYALQEMFIEDIADGTTKPNIPIRIQIPVNLRKDYPTKSLRNFSYLYSPSFNIFENKHSFPELVEKMSSEIRHERHTDSLKNQISRNLRAENNIFFKLLPRVIKKILFKVLYHLFARSQYSGVLTNMGDIKLPPTMENLIESFDIIPCNSPVPGRNTALYSFNGKLEMNIGSSCNDLRLETKIINQMKELSIEYKVIYKRD